MLHDQWALLQKIAGQQIVSLIPFYIVHSHWRGLDWVFCSQWLPSIIIHSFSTHTMHAFTIDDHWYNTSSVSDIGTVLVVLAHWELGGTGRGKERKNWLLYIHLWQWAKHFLPSSSPPSPWTDLVTVFHLQTTVFSYSNQWSMAGVWWLHIGWIVDHINLLPCDRVTLPMCTLL